MQKDFIAVTPDSGSGNATVTVATSENQTENSRTSKITIAGGGISRTVNVNQAKGVVIWEYTFTVSSNSLSFGAASETKSVTITSTKQKKINGKNSGSPITVSYTRANSGTGVSGSGTSITMARNPSTSSRSGSVKFTQNESGKIITVNLTQLGATKNVITCTVTVRPPAPTQIVCTAQYAVKSDVIVKFHERSTSNLRTMGTITKGNKQFTTGGNTGSFPFDDVQLSVDYESSDNYVYEAKKAGDWL